MKRSQWMIFLLVSLVAGILLRLSFPGDIEYKYDEQYMFNAVRAVGPHDPWPTLGMTSGVQIPNPGMSVWVFLTLARIFPITTPPDLARAVQILNILALALLMVFAWKWVEEKERLNWCWAAALVAVNPFAVLFERKIWAQCTLPFFLVLFWIAWHYRRKPLGAFFWGLIGACLGQVHLSGFFFAAAVFLGTLLYDRLSAKWPYWFAGSVLGAIPLYPWLQFMLGHKGQPFQWSSLLWCLYPKFWVYWVADPLGIGLTYSLKTLHFLDFLRYPLIGGFPTFLVGLCHGVILWVAFSLGYSLWKQKKLRVAEAGKTETGLALTSVLWIMGILLTLSRVQLFRHYLVITFPLEWVWLSRMARRDKGGNRSLAILWGAELLLSVFFLLYIHVNHGDPLGDYGTTFQAQ